jgi:DNA-directed RNA polymerase specialized sigma24 family protein
VNQKGDINHIVALLGKEDPKTVRYYIHHLHYIIRRQMTQMGLSQEDIEEIVLDAVTLLIRKIQTESYISLGIPPEIYLKKVATFRAYHYLRKIKKSTLPIEVIDSLPDKTDINYLDRWDKVELALEELKDNERSVIELTYIDGYKDQEIIDRQLSPYTNVNSLKSQRYKIVQKLIKIIRGDAQV